MHPTGVNLLDRLCLFFGVLTFIAFVARSGGPGPPTLGAVAMLWAVVYAFVATYWIAGQLGEWRLAGCIAGGVELGLANHLTTE